MLLRNKLSFIILNFNDNFKMAASIGSHFENIKSQYLQKQISDFHEICIKMFSFPNSFRPNAVVVLLSFPFKSAVINVITMPCRFILQLSLETVFIYLFISVKTSLTFKCLIENLLAYFSYSRPLDTYLWKQMMKMNRNITYKWCNIDKNHLLFTKRKCHSGYLRHPVVLPEEDRFAHAE